MPTTVKGLSWSMYVVSSSSNLFACSLTPMYVGLRKGVEMSWFVSIYNFPDKKIENFIKTSQKMKQEKGSNKKTD